MNKCQELCPVLGQKVRYVRIVDGNIVSSDGIVHAVFISPDKRMQVRVQDGLREDGKPQTYNIDPIAINSTPNATLKYLEHTNKVQQLADTVNAEIKKKTQEANAEIDDMNTAYMGAVYDV